MKKSLALLCGLLAAAACTKEAPMENAPAKETPSIKFEITVNPLTKAVKADWEEGDAVFVFFNGSEQTYLKLTRTGDGWEYNVIGSESDITDATTKKLTAVFLPFASNLEPTYDGGWKFQKDGKDIRSYYMVDENATYTTGYDVDGTTLLVKGKVTLKNEIEKSVQF